MPIYCYAVVKIDTFTSMDDSNKQVLEQLERLNKQTEVVIALLLKALPSLKSKVALRDQVGLLSELGVRPVDIAKIIGRSPGYVNKELVALRKSRVRKDE